jgi:hypothetical protein
MFEAERIEYKIEHASFTIGRRSDGVVHMFLKDGVEITVELQEDFVKAYSELYQGFDFPVLYEPGEGCGITKEARENAIRIEHLTPICATAVLAPNTVYQLIANFYLKFNKPKLPYKVYKNHEEAIAWLQTFVV